FFGRYHCTARNPRCEVCPLLDMCQEGKNRMKLHNKDKS
ncbi:MAG: endonuclease III, partial [Enterococcus sp.]|nr:endonuclease III [Enterococcus sp.]